MPARLTKEIVIERSNIKHKNRYDYSKVVYKNKNTNIIIGCSIHGFFEQSPHNHMNGAGCPKCGLESRAIKRAKGKDKFISESKEKHGENHFDYSKVVYINNNQKVRLKCNIHDTWFDVTPKSHLRSMDSCPKCAIETSVNRLTRCEKEYIELAKSVHGDIYDYSLTVYTNSKEKIEIICETHGSFWQEANSHLQGVGCPQCGWDKVGALTRIHPDEWVLRFIKIHVGRYDYSLFLESDNVWTCEDSIPIICKEHGVFYQRIENHANGSNCVECLKEDGYLGWHRGDWVKFGKKSNRFDSFKLYKIRCYNEIEEFYKIGITFVELKYRFPSKKSMPYNYEIVELIESDDGEYIWNLEKELHRQHKEFKYIPKIEFGGMYECFTKLI